MVIQVFDLNKLKARLCRFIRLDQGSTLPILAALIVPMLGFVGLATDAARGYIIKTRLHDALDAAALASSHEVFSDNFESEMGNYFRANFPAGYLGAQVTLDTPVVSSDKQVVSVSARATINTSFMKLLGLDTINVSSETEVTRRTTSLDLVIAIDMSGSMNDPSGSGGTRIEAARDAAETLIEILYGNAESKDLLKVGLVPWNGKVNVSINGGAAYNPALTQTVSVPSFQNPITGVTQTEVYIANNSPVPLLSIPPAGWPGCVYARYLKDGRTNDADIYLSAATVDNKDWMAWQPNNDPTSQCPSHGITPLQDSKTGILDAIAELTTPIHDTVIPQGLAWAWRAVSPVAPFEESEANPVGDHKRAIVLLTDGKNAGWTGAAYNGQFGKGPNSGPNGLNDRTRKVADNIKAAGIQVFAIQFAENATSLTNLMKDVATQPNAPYYHFAPDGDALEAAFEEVADQLSSLRVSR